MPQETHGLADRSSHGLERCAPIRLAERMTNVVTRCVSAARGGGTNAMAVRASTSATRLGVLSRHVCGSASAATPEVVFERRGSVAWLTLARPKALNALTLPMIRALRPALEQSASDASVRCIVMVGEGGRAFCAGGDVRAVCEAAQGGDAALPDAFFREEYHLNSNPNL